MARRIVAKLFGSAQAVSPEVSDALAELAKLAKEHPELAGPRALLSEILPRLFQEPNEETAPEIARAHGAAKLASGIPLVLVDTIVPGARAASTFPSRSRLICRFSATASTIQSQPRIPPRWSSKLRSMAGRVRW